MDLYARIHKGQRAWFARLLIVAGRIGAGEADEAAALASEVGRLVMHLGDHSAHEERFIHPLLAEAAPEIARLLGEQHASLEPAIDVLARAAEAHDASQIYRTLASLMAQYFAHLDVEEYQAMPALQQHFEDAALIERVAIPFNRSRGREEALADLLLQLQALTPAESFELIALYAS